MIRQADVELRLHNQEATFEAGTVITGRLSVQSFVAGQQSAVAVFVSWKTGGLANVYEGTRTRQVLYEGPWKVDDRRSFDFELPLRPWPVSYRGTMFSIDYTVGYQVRVEGKQLTEGRAPITVVAGPRTAPHLLPLAPKHTGATDHMPGCLICSGVLLSSGFGFALFAANAGGALTEPGVVAAVLTSLGLLAVIGGSWTYVAERKLGEVFVGLEPIAHAGGPLKVFVRFTPKTDVRVNSIEATLRGKEKAVQGEGENASPLNAELPGQELTLATETVVRAGETWESEQSFSLSPRMPPSIDVEDHEVSWQVNLRIDIPSWPDWVHTYDVLITPPHPFGVNVTLKQPELAVSTRPQLHQLCPYCRDGVGDDPQALVTCAGCRTVFHKECLREFGTCSTRGCRSKRIRI